MDGEVAPVAPVLAFWDGDAAVCGEEVFDLGGSLDVEVVYFVGGGRGVDVVVIVMVIGCGVGGGPCGG